MAYPSAAHASATSGSPVLTRVQSLTRTDSDSPVPENSSVTTLAGTQVAARLPPPDTSAGRQSPSLSDREPDSSGETSALLVSVSEQSQAALNRAQRYIEQLPPSQRRIFQQQGLDAKTLAPLCEQVGSDDNQKITEALDSLLRGIVACPEDGDLRHHLPQRAAMGGLAFVGSGINRPFGFGGLARLMPGSETTQNILSGVITGGSQVSDGAQGAFGSNRLKMEGGEPLSSWFSRSEWKRWYDNGGWWSWSGYGLSLLSTGTLGGMAYLGAISLGLSWPVGLAFGLAKTFGSLPFYSIALSKFTDTVRGMDPEAEELAKRSVTLLKQMLDTMGSNLILANDCLDRRITGYAQTLGLQSRREKGVTARLASALCLYDPGARCRNIVSEIRKAMAASPESSLNGSNLTLKGIFNYAQQRRSTWHWGWRAAGMAVATTLMAVTSWGEAATVANLLMSSFGPFVCSGAGAVFHNLAWQGVMGMAMAARSLGQAVILRDNILGAVSWLVKMIELVRGQRELDWRSIYEPKKCLLGAASAFCYFIGVASSICYSLSFAGAIYTNTAADVCLGMFISLSYVLPVVGSLPMLVATLKMGKEIKTIIFASVKQGKKICLTLGKGLTNQCHGRRTLQPWYIQNLQEASQGQRLGSIQEIDCTSGAVLNVHPDSDEETHLVAAESPLTRVKERVRRAESALVAGIAESVSESISERASVAEKASENVAESTRAPSAMLEFIN